MNAPSSPILEVRDISKAFGHVQALNHVSFPIQPGEVTALLGDNGAGKSTVVKVLSGALRPDEGEVILGGTPIDMHRPSDAINHGIATVFQDLALVNTLDVGRNVYLGIPPTRFGFIIDFPRLYRQSRDLLRDLRVDIPSVHASVSELSGGQRQAVALARAMAKEAEIVIMDEPTAALGVTQTAVVNELIRELSSAGKTVIVISHNLEEIFQIADTIVVLRLGRCVGIRKAAGVSHEEIVGMITGAIRS